MTSNHDLFFKHSEAMAAEVFYGDLYKSCPSVNAVEIARLFALWPVVMGKLILWGQQQLRFRVCQVRVCNC